MSTARLALVVALSMAACASWNSTSPSYVAPPTNGPTPSHYAPPPAPVEPTDPPTEPASDDLRVAIASVQLRDDCPEPAAAAANEPDEPDGKSSQMAGASYKPTEDYRRGCAQSMVHLSVTSAQSGQFRIEAIRVLDPASKRSAGTALLRGPTHWDAASATYPPWDERMVGGQEQKIGYKLGALDLARAHELVGPEFNVLMGPYILELDVSVGGRRRTIRSSEFSREPEEVMVT